MTTIDRGHRPDAYYYLITPECPRCHTPFPDCAEHLDTAYKDEVIHQIIECTDCEIRWELRINHGDPTVNGIEAWIRPAIFEYRPHLT